MTREIILLYSTVAFSIYRSVNVLTSLVPSYDVVVLTEYPIRDTISRAVMIKKLLFNPALGKPAVARSCKACWDQIVAGDVVVMVIWVSDASPSLELCLVMAAEPSQAYPLIKNNLTNCETEAKTVA